MIRLPVSVCMIAGAEARRIERTLASVADWTSEIIVVLNEEVTDGTDEIARRHGATIFREPWKGHVAQKNSAAEKARQPWLLGLDCDEVVTPELRREIKVTLGNLRDGHPVVAYSFPRCSECFGRWIRHGDWYPDRKVRLWKRGRGKWTGIDPHDKLSPDGPVGRMSSDLQHYTVESIDEHVSKLIRYSRIFAEHRSASRQSAGIAQLVARPMWRFIRGYVLRLGFLDGWQGYYIARMTAFDTFLRYARVVEAEKNVRTKKSGSGDLLSGM